MFREILESLVIGVPGALGAVFVDWEGETVDFFTTRQEYEMKLLGAHHSIILHMLGEVSGGFGYGKVGSLNVTTGSFRMMVRPLNEGYSIILLLSAASNAGKAGRALELASRRIYEEL